MLQCIVEERAILILSHASKKAKQGHVKLFSFLSNAFAIIFLMALRHRVKEVLLYLVHNNTAGLDGNFDGGVGG